MRRRAAAPPLASRSGASMLPREFLRIIIPGSPRTPGLHRFNKFNN